jgi:deoxyribose-phosphate aldolase
MKLIKPLNKYFDHTILKAFASSADMDKVIDECIRYNFQMIAINSVQVKYCHAKLKDFDVNVGAAIGFPLGQTTIETKIFETQNAIDHGCDEIDYVVNLSEVKNGNWNYVEREMKAIVDICKEQGIISKVIFENCYLNQREIMALAQIARVVGPDYIKTSTGFGTGGATVEDVRLMKEFGGPDVQVKAAGGIRDLKTALAMIEAGATRIGSSAGCAIMDEYNGLEQGLEIVDTY